MKKLEIVDKAHIGNLDIEAYILDDDNQLKAFGIFVEGHDNALILFQQELDGKSVNININTKLIEVLNKNKSEDPNLRKEIYNSFREFVLESEQTAREKVFKDKKFNYLTDVELIKSIEKDYL